MLINILFSPNLNQSNAIIIFCAMFIVFVFSISLHEFAHAFAAYKMGDITPKAAGRLTLNPAKHIDTMGMLMFLFAGIGWAKPVPINPTNFKKYRKGIRWVSIAGVLANFLLGLLAAVISLVLYHTVGFPNSSINILYDFLKIIMQINGLLAMFNLIPIYPLDGFNFITSFMKSNNKFIHYMIKNGFKIILTILIIDIVVWLMFPVSILDTYLYSLYDYVLYPISRLGV